MDVDARTALTVWRLLPRIKTRDAPIFVTFHKETPWKERKTLFSHSHPNLLAKLEMGLLDIIRKPKPSPEPCKAKPSVEPWMANLLSAEEFTTGCLLDEVPLPQPKRDEARKLANGLAVSAYRRIYSDGQVGASPEMSDALILDIYRQVGRAFRAVATERGEFIQSGVINVIVLKFLEVYRLDGQDFFDEHLKYEIQKYRREGLRADYSRKPLHLFRPPDDVNCS